MFLRGFAAGCAVSAASVWAAYRVFLEPRSNIFIDYQELPGHFDQFTKGCPPRLNEIMKYGTPQRSADVSFFQNHALCYDQQKRIPHWVAEHITKDHLTGSANRKHSNFKPDPSVPMMFSAQNDDYWKSGWSRGHMAPAGNNKYNQDAMNNTFYLSNIVPQDIDNNAGFWNRFEMYCRDLTKEFDHVRIISGPLFISQMENGKRQVKYEVLGNSEVAVPTHLFKVIVAEKENSDKRDKILLGAFVVPNKPISKEHLLTEYQVPLEYVESKSGFKMLPLLDHKEIGDLCKEKGCTIISWEKFELHFMVKKLESANTVKRLEKVWKELLNKRIQPDDALISMYNAKKKDLEQKENVRLER